jgi:hypothetical protein
MSKIGVLQAVPKEPLQRGSGVIKLHALRSPFQNMDVMGGPVHDRMGERVRIPRRGPAKSVRRASREAPSAEPFCKPVTRKRVLQDQQIGAPDHARLQNVLPGDVFIFGAAHPARHVIPIP